MEGSRPARPLRLLFVCTANQCRSPLGEVIARGELAVRGVDALIGSAGTHAVDGAPATDQTQMVAKEYRADLSGHLSRPVTRELVSAADLVLCMEPAHVIDIVGLHGGDLRSTYTLPELALDLALVDGHDGVSGEPWGGWLARVSPGRDAAVALGAPSIADPIGRSNRRYRSAGKAIADSIEVIADHLAARSSLS